MPARAGGCGWTQPCSQVEDGLAWCFTRYLKHPAECLPRERAARETKKGLWTEVNPQAPWELRAAMQR